MICSMKKHATEFALLPEQVHSCKWAKRFHCPVGLPSRSTTPKKTSVSIFAECIAHRRDAQTKPKATKGRKQAQDE